MLNKKYMFGVLFLLAFLIAINNASAVANLTFKDPIKYQGANNTALKRLSSNYTMVLIWGNNAGTNRTVNIVNVTLYYNTTSAGAIAKALMNGISSNTTATASLANLVTNASANASAISLSFVTGSKGTNLGTAQPDGTLYWIKAAVGYRISGRRSVLNTSAIKFIRVDNAKPGVTVLGPSSPGYLWPNNTFSARILADENITTANMIVNGKTYAMTRAGGTGADARTFTAVTSADLNEYSYQAVFNLLDNASTANLGTGKIDFNVVLQPSINPELLDQRGASQIKNVMNNELTNPREFAKTTTGLAVGAIIGGVIGFIGGPVGVGMGALIGGSIGTFIGAIL